MLTELLNHCAGAGFPTWELDRIREITAKHNLAAAALDKRIAAFAEQWTDAQLEAAGDCASLEAVSAKLRRSRLALVAESRQLLRQRLELLGQVEAALNAAISEAGESTDAAATAVAKSLQAVGLSVHEMPGYADDPHGVQARFNAMHIRTSQPVADLIAWQSSLEGYRAGCGDIRAQTAEKLRFLDDWVNRQVAAAFAA